jgi:hypothetical protein
MAVDVHRGGRLLCIALAAFAACGKSTDDRDDTLPNGADFGREWALATCDAGFDCGFFDANFRLRCRLGYEAAARELELEAALHRGTTRYEPDRAEACLQAARETCMHGEAGVCQHVFTGTVAPGGACVVDEECVDGGACVGSDAPDSPQFCESRRAQGEECGNAIYCAANPGEVAFCEDFDGSQRCYAATTVQEVAEGESCGMWPLEASGEVEVFFCAAGLRCASGVCGSLLEAGDPCESDEDCGRDAICMSGEYGCTPILIREEVGDSCGLDLETIPGVHEDCDADTLACVDGVCELKGDGSEGSICDERQFAYGCDEGLACESSHCVPSDRP